MLSRSDIEMISPYGYRILVLDCENLGDVWRIFLEFQDKKHVRLPFRINLDLPAANGPNIIMDGIERTVLPAITEEGIRSRRETLRALLQQAFERALSDFIFNGGPIPNSNVIMAEFRALVARSPFVVDTPPDAPLEKKGFEAMVRMDSISGNPIDVTWREFQEKYWGLLDPNSTSQSGKINRVYRKATKDHSLCDSLGKNIIFARANPRRIFLTRTAIERHLPQLTPEVPLVANKENQLSGKTLLTAFMDLGNTTFEDSIAISKSAASALTCVKTIRQTWVGYSPLKLLVPEGNMVRPKALLAKTVDGIEGVHATKIYYPAKLVSVEQFNTTKFKKKAYRYVFIFRAELPLRTGDKIAGRHGNKGIAWVVEDKFMPVMRNDDFRMRIDVCISPISVIKRRMMSLYLEGMCAKKALRTRKRFLLPGWDIPSDFSFVKLVNEGWGDKDQLYMNGIPLPERTFVAPLLWLRLDKIAAEQVSFTTGSVVRNHLGVPIDSARVNGQKRDVSKSLAFLHKPISGILRYTIEKNTIGVDKCEAVAQILEPGFKFLDIYREG